MQNRMMNWDDVKIFLAIAKAGSLGAAARACGQTQPTMGRRLKALEGSLGQTLFQRTSHGFVLTDEGAAILAHAQRMEEEAVGLERALAGQDQRLEGSLRVTSSDWFGVHVLTPVLSRFNRAHPGVALELVTESRPLSLARRETDIAFRIVRFEEADVIQRKLLRLDYRLYRRRGAEAEAPRIITMDLAFRHLPDAVWLRERFPDAPITIRSNSREVQAKACIAGAGLAVLPTLMADSIPGLERCKAEEAPPGRDVWMGYHRDLRRLPRLRALVDFFVAGLASP